jgi:hypothetical protein
LVCVPVCACVPARPCVTAGQIPQVALLDGVVQSVSSARASSTAAVVGTGTGAMRPSRQLPSAVGARSVVGGSGASGVGSVQPLESLPGVGSSPLGVGVVGGGEGEAMGGNPGACEGEDGCVPGPRLSSVPSLPLPWHLDASLLGDTFDHNLTGISTLGERDAPAPALSPMPG